MSLDASGECLKLVNAKYTLFALFFFLKLSSKSDQLQNPAKIMQRIVFKDQSPAGKIWPLRLIRGLGASTSSPTTPYWIGRKWFRICY
jgi:hypothetical protein